MRKILFVFALLSILTQTKAQTVDNSFKAEVAKAFELQKTKETMTETMRLQMLPLVEQGKITSDNLNRFVVELVEFMLPFMLEKMVKLYEQYFTLDEIKQMNAYLATPAGQKWIKVAPMFTTEGIKVASSEPVQNKIQGLLSRYMNK